MKLYCITLGEERYNKARRHFEEIGLEVQFFQGIDGEKLGLRSIVSHQRQYIENKYFIPDFGHIGCALSHLALWRALLLIEEEEFIILEDDAIIPPNFLKQFKLSLRNIPRDKELVYIGYVERECIPLGTHCYWVNKYGLRKLVFNILKMRAGIDLLILEDAYLNWYRLPKSLVENGSAMLQCDSLTRQEKFDYDKVFNKLPSGWLSYMEGRLLIETLWKTKGEVIEVGSHLGRSAYLLASTGRYVWCIDSWQDNYLEWKDGHTRYEEFKENTKGLSVAPLRIDVNSSQALLEPCEMVYLDGDHSEEGTIKQIVFALKRNPLYIAIHDVGDKGAATVVRDTAVKILGKWSERVETMAVWKLR